MAQNTDFRARLQSAIEEFPQSQHPIIDKWASGEVKRETIAGAITQIWYWISTIVGRDAFIICSKAPKDVVDRAIENFQEETDPANPHNDLILRFADACGMTREKLDQGRPLPTTQAWVDWSVKVAENEPWFAGIAALNVASEAQEPKLINRVLPALRETYGFSEHELEFWWEHAEADVEHGDRAFQMLERHCTTPEMQDLAVHWARDGARMKYFFWDGINLHYEVGYKLQN